MKEKEYDFEEAKQEAVRKPSPGKNPNYDSD